MTIAIYGKFADKNNLESILGLFKKLDSLNIEILIHEGLFSILKEICPSEKLPKLTFNNHLDIKNRANFLISIGGDGTFLDTISLVKDSNIPILGINTGRLGFLSNTSTSEIDLAIESLISNDFNIEKRSLLELIHENSIFEDQNFALNEISVLKKDTSSMIIVHVDLDGTHLNSYWTDGLIISTATGSTAYSLSCGGPILMPGSGNFVITPIAPHNLNVRPIVISDNSILTLTIEGRTESNLIALDSRSKKIINNEKVIIKKASHQISLVQLNHDNFINSLKNKLSWGLDKRNI
jgi:NAD+ kinase